MKREIINKARVIVGVVCLALAVLLCGTAVTGHVMAAGTDNAYTRAVDKNALIAAHKTADTKTAPSAVKKAQIAVNTANTALKDSTSALDEANSHEDARTMTALKKSYDSVCKSVSAAESKLKSAINGVNDVYAACGGEYASPVYETYTKQTYESPDGYMQALTDICAHSESLCLTAADVSAHADDAQLFAREVASSDSITFSQRLFLLIGSRPIGFAFTAFLCAVAGVCLVWLSHAFMRAWKKYPVFSTFIAMLVMIVIQVYARGFAFKTYGQWASAWLINMLNVLRSNSSVGMIALGMTFVIITGGIDLAVGSNIAGVATVVMVLLDVSSKGRLTAAGVTGVPNYVIAILAGLAAGSLIGLLTGLGITKGRVPPFIITLGIMNIVRSLAQYFTKSYKAEVPREFQVIANYEFKALGGQMLLPIIYWLLLAALMYVISRHTAFGRHIYAVGSNERASRLSGINVDRVKTGVYTLMGVIVAIAAVTSVARLRGVDVASAGSGFEMDAIAAVVVGGTSMAGGRGSIIGTVFGVLIIGIMNNLLVLMHVDSFLANAFTGIIIIFAVLIQRKES